MRILLLNSVCGVTSTGRICADLAKAYEENGHEVKIAYGRDDKGMSDACARYGVRIGTNLDVKLHGRTTAQSLLINTANDRYFLPALEDMQKARKHLESVRSRAQSDKS